MRPFPPIAFLAALAGLAAAIAGSTGCSRTSQSASPPSPATSTLIDSDGGGVITIDGVTIEVTGVPFRYVSTSQGAGRTQDARTIAGHPYGVSGDGMFFIGPKRYGSTPSGTTVRVTPEGVFIGDERRGDVPPTVPRLGE